MLLFILDQFYPLLFSFTSLVIVVDVQSLRTIRYSFRIYFYYSCAEQVTIELYNYLHGRIILFVLYVQVRNNSIINSHLTTTVQGLLSFDVGWHSLISCSSIAMTLVMCNIFMHLFITHLILQYYIGAFYFNVTLLASKVYPFVCILCYITNVMHVDNVCA